MHNNLSHQAIAIFFIAACSISTGATAKTHRSHVARYAFVKQHACPATGRHRLPCPGWVIDHIIALACGGADSPENMQWQTREEAKDKDKWERIGC
jgi:5-methylcytosine-specific restriction endonuclease McrA